MRSRDGGEVLLRKRRKLKLTQRELAFISGCSHAFIGQLERDESTVSPDLAESIAFRLGCDVEDLFVEHRAPANPTSVMPRMPTANAVSGQKPQHRRRVDRQPNVTPEVA